MAHGSLTLLSAAVFASCLATGDARTSSDQSGPPRSTSQPESPSGSDYVRLKVVRIMDNSGFGQPVEAFRFLMPTTWRVEGGIQWVNSFGCLPLTVQGHVRAISPDGLMGMELFPGYTWNWFDDPYQRQMTQQAAAAAGGPRPCDMAPMVGAAGFITGKLVPGFRRGARVISTEPLPQVAQSALAAQRAYMQQAAAMGLQIDLKTDAARVKLSYQINGQPVEEWVTATIQYTTTMTPSASAAMQGQLANTPSHSAYTSYLLGAWSSPGGLERNSALFTTMISSIKPNITWTSAISQVLSGMNNTATRGAMDRARIWSQAQREISDIQRQGYEYSQQSQARVASAWSQTTRGIETYVDPTSNERVELSSGYRGAWSNGQGEYILSDDPNFNPREIQGNWREMQHGR
ncbi:MAG: hypothetical protein ABI679_06585 [Gemmatimonadota bacterium]